jgi:catechol 2,3-dioxygenase-like lactoylglutathione lyase family enzyme
MGLVDISGCHHIRLTVTDIARSLEFYTDVLGFTVLVRSPGDPEDPALRADPNQLYGGAVMSSGSLVLGLRPVAAAGDRFDSEKPGLDHLSFSVASRSVLEDVRAGLDERGVVHGEIKELTGFGIAIMSIDDPDGIHLELTSPLS